jgi:hypothetical protein
MNSNSNNSNVEFHRRKTFKRRRNSNMNTLSNNLNKMKLKKKVTFRHNRNNLRYIPKEEENVEARKSIVVNKSNRNNMNMYNKRKTAKQLKLRGNAYRNYLAAKRTFGNYHLESSEKEFLDSIV